MFQALPLGPRISSSSLTDWLDVPQKPSQQQRNNNRYVLWSIKFHSYSHCVLRNKKGQRKSSWGILIVTVQSDSIKHIKSSSSSFASLINHLILRVLVLSLPRDPPKPSETNATNSIIRSLPILLLHLLALLFPLLVSRVSFYSCSSCFSSRVSVSVSAAVAVINQNGRSNPSVLLFFFKRGVGKSLNNQSC